MSIVSLFVFLGRGVWRVIFEKQTPQSVSFQGEEGHLSAWGVAQELDSKSSDPVTLHTSVSCGHLLSCPLSD